MERSCSDMVEILPGETELFIRKFKCELFIKKYEFIL